MIYVAFSKMCPTENARTLPQIIHFFRCTPHEVRERRKRDHQGPSEKTQKKRGHVRSLHQEQAQEGGQ